MNKQKIEKLLEAKSYLLNDYFGGWQDEDIAYLERYKQNIEHVKGDSEEIIDWLGIKTDINLHAWMKKPGHCLRIGELPLPDDGVHAEAIEYIALFIALERAVKVSNLHLTGENNGQLVVLELGASYGPWLVAAGVVGRRLGFSKINLIGVEANKDAIKKLLDHAQRNGVDNPAIYNLKPMHYAVHTKDEELFFPKVNTSTDNGAQATTLVQSNDYRGLRVEYERVPGITFTSLSKDFDVIHFLHMDLQGHEKHLLENDEFMNALTDKVATLYLATQSRLIEGIALEKLSKVGWMLVRERPTMYQQNERTHDVNGWTLRDGGQLWINKKF